MTQNIKSSRVMLQISSSRTAANRRYYERNRERILKRRKDSRNETRAQLQLLEEIMILCSQTHYCPTSPRDPLYFESSQNETMPAQDRRKHINNK
ncbi:10003_t:CDS:2 [Cetraspora pellucida]|uniref:10003_t:CDS:1 n=1 Tax=Cetraspora pellucida TaxID=1433469 RepID=A0A9N9EC36_9GLOM|nr:10003_t:CDS:2 [Cetraspora pellucida]